MPQQYVNFVVARGEFDSSCRRAGFEQGTDGIGRAYLCPVRIDASFDGELERGAASGVGGVDRRASGDQFLDDFA